MASKKQLKKDIDKVVYEIVADCYSYMDLYPKENHQPVEDLAYKALDLQDDILTKINMHQGRDNPKETKEYFNSIKKEFMEEAEKIFSELDKYFKAKEEEK